MPTPSARRFLLVTAAVAILEVAAVGAFVVGVDARGEHGGGLAPAVLEDSEGAKLTRFDALASPPTALFLGSSRALQVAPADAPPTLTRGTAFNFATSGGGVGHARAALAHAVAAGRPPEVVVYGIEVDQLRPGVPTGVVFGPAALGPSTPRPDAWEGWLGALSWGQLRDALRAASYLARERPAADVVYDADGLAHVRPPQRAVSVEDEIRAEAPAHAARYASYGRLDPSAVEELRGLLADARASGAVVHVYLTPLHPTYRDGLRGTAFDDLQAELVRVLEGECGPAVHVHDFTDLSSVGGDAADMLDRWHAGRATGALVLAALAEGREDRCA